MVPFRPLQPFISNANEYLSNIDCLASNPCNSESHSGSHTAPHRPSLCVALLQRSDEGKYADQTLVAMRRPVCLPGCLLPRELCHKQARSFALESNCHAVTKSNIEGLFLRISHRHCLSELLAVCRGLFGSPDFRRRAVGARVICSTNHIGIRTGRNDPRCGHTSRYQRGNDHYSDFHSTHSHSVLWTSRQSRMHIFGVGVRDTAEQQVGLIAGDPEVVVRRLANHHVLSEFLAVRICGFGGSNSDARLVHSARGTGRHNVGVFADRYDLGRRRTSNQKHNRSENIDFHSLFFHSSERRAA